MARRKPLPAKDGRVLLLVGTAKGAFVFAAGARRTGWRESGPHFRGSAVYAMTYDGRQGRRRIWASSASMHWGALLRHSDDFGRTWTDPESASVKFPPDAGLSLKQIWQIHPGRRREKGTLYAGVEPTALFVSRDAGETWSLVRGLHDHPHRPRWEPGGGGLCLHTILPDPAKRGRLLVAISTGGVYGTDDGGRTWRAMNRGIRAEFLPDKHPEFGQCVHKVVQHPARPERLFLQNHWGLYKSDDAGESWQDVANGVPSDFGFCMALHPRDPDCAYIVPLESDMFRCPPQARLRVYRTRDAGASWRALSQGLPQRGAFETVLRDALAVDALEPAGVYMGTRSGKLYGSADEGDRWQLIRDGLPPVVCVKAAVLA